MAICMLVCLLAYLKMTCRKHQTSQNFLYMLPVAVGRLSPDDNAIRYVLPVLWMTSCFPITGYMSHGYVKRAYSQNDSPEGVTDFSVLIRQTAPAVTRSLRILPGACPRGE